ncbi:MAG TPA: hypothetical protein VLB27_08020, partial [candidate division Zixibacteria bacterium]|nr:hypothetical protein [candidate division Zixibacteria bacterium]
TLSHPRFLQDDPVDNRPHRPLNVKVVQRSMQWSYEYAQDFVMFDYQITNIDKEPLLNVYIGVYVDGDTYYLSNALDPAVQFQNPVVSGSPNDDLCGFLKSFPARCGYTDTLNVAYIMDNDGDPNPPNSWSTVYSLRNVAGVKMLRTPDPYASRQFNWWISGPPWYDFGPRYADYDLVPFRDMDGYLGTPYGDKNKYYVMRNREHDYDQMTMALSHEDGGWLPPTNIATFLSRGASVKFLLSYGPFAIYPGQSVPFTFAYIAGERVHTVPEAHQMLFDPFRPQAFKSTLDFSDFALNSRWASWIYDNPGIDTDLDGYRGKSRECVVEETAYIETTYIIDSTILPYDTQLTTEVIRIPLKVQNEYYEGDGVPDFVGASPPPAPPIKLIPEHSRITVRWNGYASETTPDPFTDEVDFEGYRVYSSFTPDPQDFVMLTSYDLPNYNRYEYNESQQEWELIENPFTLEELQALYGPTFYPQDFTIDNPLVARGDAPGETTLYYFTTTDWNRNELNVPGSIRKRFPDAPPPPSDPDLWTPDDLTEEGLPKFYEYEYTIEDLLPSIPIYVSVTAFDFGSPRVDLPSLETIQTLNMVREFPLQSTAAALAAGDPVVVYPNPYRIDGNYRAKGFEGRGREQAPDERVREIHFINLPLVCDIFIYSLDGDMVRQIQHHRPEGGPESMHDSWNVLSRNLQPVVSGIYIWVVKEPDGAVQMGKLAIIM